MTEPDWWQTFFAEPWSRIQAGGYPTERTANECDLIQGALDLKEGARVLDIPCGIGRHSVELARRGFQMTGVDFNPDFVASARASAALAKVHPRFQVCDMRDFTSSEAFDAAFCYFGSFGYFRAEEDAKFVHRIAASLRPGGRFLIDSHIAETLLPIHRERDWYWAGPPGGAARVLEERRWNMETGRVEATLTIVDDDGMLSSWISIRIYTYRELRELLQRAGFGAVSVFDGKTGLAFRFGAPRALIVAELPQR